MEKGENSRMDDAAQQRVERAVNEIIGEESSSEYDPLGSYTGTPADPLERPIQDADDLS